MTLPPRKPDWLRIRLPSGERQERMNSMRARMRSRDLHTVCEEAGCPNLFECWGEGTATIMILGETCTRACKFCSVHTGDPGGLVDPREPESTATALADMGLAYVVLTMVDRDDLLDGGAAHVAQTIRRIKHHSPSLLVETLVGDFAGVMRDVRKLVKDGRPDVFAHNAEVVPRLQLSVRDRRCSWERSTDVLREAKQAGARVTKSSLMLGVGETQDEVIEAMQLLREADVNVLTLGQYLRPTAKHHAVERYVPPAEFDAYRDAGLEMGYSFVASGPLVRSSYRAAEAFLHGVLGGQGADLSREQGVDSFGKKTKTVLEVIQ
ncbi:MAG: lipoyl synthase [Myxococcales bacterium]|nr:lipoyl synthase [Myxococcales bacterium]